jgi:hypothetical protein
MGSKMYCTAIYRGYRVYILHELSDYSYVGTVINVMGRIVLEGMTSTRGETCKAMCLSWIDGELDEE